MSMKSERQKLPSVQADLVPDDRNGRGALSADMGSVRRFFVRRLRGLNQDADDLTQEVCTRFLATHASCTVVEPRRYLFGIARHVLADFLAQRRDRREMAMDGEVLRECELTAGTLLDPTDAVSDNDMLCALLKYLPVTHRNVLIAHEGLGYSYREVAERLGLAEQTVQTYLKLAKARLRTLSLG